MFMGESTKKLKTKK